MTLEEKIKNRLINLNDELIRLKDSKIVWIKSTGGLTRKDRIQKCEYLIEELQDLLDI